MSDPLTNLEIQDVLSSIRRLVSEDNRHRSEPEKERREEREGKRADDAPGERVETKLVLTEALRVPEADGVREISSAGEDTLRQSVSGDSVFDDAEHLPDADVALPDGSALLRDWDVDSASDAQSLEDTIAELEAAVAGIGGEFEPDGSEVAKGVPTDAALEDAFEDGFAVDEAAEEESADLTQPVTSGEMGNRHVASAPAWQGGDETSDDETEVAAADGALDEPVVADEAALEYADLDDARSAEPMAHDLADATEEGGPDAVPAFVHGGGLRPSRETAEAAPVSTAPSRRLTLTAADAVRGGEAQWDRDDAPEAEPLINDGPESGAFDDVDGDDSSGLFSAGDETVIDMDMLRDIVAEIIREELQGPLGERITRNVRMLVRREINRALESRNLD
ncbi:hypothetical protein [Defluviimonas sp. SAOS-178_SWC]|uniref:hypothetical protein n=1 Tax=Defluviimonas sp. SAOS-178_SWC TaxID=3121287 RepID=UPI00322196DD